MTLTSFRVQYGYSSVLLDWLLKVGDFLKCEINISFRFGDTVENEFYLSTYQTRSQLLSAINDIDYESLGNRRNVEAALNAMRTEQFIASQVR